MKVRQQDRHAIVAAINLLMQVSHGNAKEKGWWDEPGWVTELKDLVGDTSGGLAYEEICQLVDENVGRRNDGEMLCLMHSELSECLEALRHNNPTDSHCPEHTNGVVELADTMVRIFDFCEERQWPLAEALLAKMDYNHTRPIKHGGKEF